MEEQAEYKVIDRRTQEQPETAITPSGPADIVMVAMQKNYDPALIEKMMDLAERNQKNVARQAYFEAVANFKAEAPTVKKDKHNNYFNSWYTSLGNLLDTYNPVLGKHGLSLSFAPPEQTEKTMTVECLLSHRLGHRESVKVTAPIDQAAIGRQSGQRSRNPIQDIKSTFTYLRSATAEAILGVAGTEATVDDDGNTAGAPETITEEQVKEIQNILKKTKTNEAAFKKWAKVNDIAEIPVKSFGNVLAEVQRKEDNYKFSCPDRDGGTVLGIECRKCKNRAGCPAHEVEK